MKCPKCDSEETKLSISDIEDKEGFVQAEVYCFTCDDTVAFFWIKDDDWILTE